MYLVHSIISGLRSPVVNTEKWVSKETAAKVVESVALLALVGGGGVLLITFLPQISFGFTGSFYVGVGLIGGAGAALTATLIAYLITHTRSHFGPGDQNNLPFEPDDGMLTEKNSVHARILEMHSDEEFDWVNFCNPKFLQVQEEDASRECDWKLHISIDPTEIYRAWDVIGEVIMKSELPIHGKIHTANIPDNTLSQPGKQVTLQVLRTDQDAQKWASLLQEIAEQLQENEIGADPRRINSDSEQASRKWDASIPIEGCKEPYFNYRSDSYTIIEDNNWNTCTQGYTISEEGNIAQPPTGNGGMVRTDYFQSLPEDKRHNPLNLEDPFRGMTIQLDVESD